MFIETEKKFKLTEQQFSDILNLLIDSVDVRKIGKHKEINTLYSGKLTETGNVYRIRELTSDSWITAKHSYMTVKKPVSNENGIKRTQEIEFYETYPHKFRELFELFELKPSLVYEKKRLEFDYKDALICLDRLPFGLYLEIEGTEEQIEAVVKFLGLNLLEESSSYPTLTREFGKDNNGVVEARFDL
jgi:adenylate cyclase class IV